MPVAILGPAADRPASNAVCRKAGFTLLGETDIEYPPGTIMRCNDWQMSLCPEDKEPRAKPAVP